MYINLLDLIVQLFKYNLPLPKLCTVALLVLVDVNKVLFSIVTVPPLLFILRKIYIFFNSH